MNHLLISGLDSCGKTTAAVVSLVHFVSEDLRKRGDVFGGKLRVLVVGPTEHASRVLARKVSELSEKNGFCAGSEDHGCFVLDRQVATSDDYRLTVSDPDHKYHYVLVDGLKSVTPKEWLCVNRLSALRSRVTVLVTESP